MAVGIPVPGVAGFTRAPGGARGLRESQQISITFDPAQLAEVEAVLSGIPNGLKKAQVGAINKVVAKTKTSLVKAAAAIMNVPRYIIAGRGGSDSAKRARPRISMVKASEGHIKPNGWVTIGTRGIEMMEFRPKQLKRGVRVKFFKDRPPILLPSHFINKGKQTGRRHVFSRVTKGSENLHDRDNPASAGELVGRYPIRIRYGPSVALLFRVRPQLFSQQFRATEEEMTRQINSQVDRLLNRKKKTDAVEANS